MNLPNKLTIARVCMIPAFVLFLALGMTDFNLTLEAARLAAAAIFVLAAATDWLDGFLARKLNQTTDFGKFMDPLADKILVMAALVYMVVLGDIPPWVLILTESREFIIAGVRMVAANKNIVIAAGLWGKLKTVAQMIMIPVVLIDVQQPQFAPLFRWAGLILIMLSVALTIVSAVDYIWKNRDAFKEGVKP